MAGGGGGDRWRFGRRLSVADALAFTAPGGYSCRAWPYHRRQLEPRLAAARLLRFRTSVPAETGVARSESVAVCRGAIPLPSYAADRGLFRFLAEKFREGTAVCGESGRWNGNR